MNIFNVLDYREVIKNSVRIRKKLESRFNFSRLSMLSGVQNTYLSKALRGHADLSPDQLFAVCECLEFPEKEREYLLLLLEHSRATLKKRKQDLARKIENIRAQHLRSEKHLTARAVALSLEGIQEYYLDPFNQIVHVCLSIEKFKKDPALLAETLKVRKQRVIAAIRTLERIGVIANEGSTVRSLVSNVHLPRDSVVYPAWRNQLRTLSLQRLQDSSADEAYSFSVVFSASPNTRAKVQTLFLDYLKAVEGLVKDSPEEQTYQMNFDLHSWT